MYNRKNKMWKYIEFALLDTFKIQLNACYAHASKSAIKVQLQQQRYFPNVSKSFAKPGAWVPIRTVLLSVSRR